MTTPTMTTAETTALLSGSLAERLIVTQVGALQLAFPAVWVSEIVRVERSQILDLPFYTPAILGIMHHKGKVVPLLSGHRLVQVPYGSLRETSTAILLNDAAGSLAQIGIVVDSAIGNQSRSELPGFDDPSANAPSEMVMMRAELLPSNLWEPLRWNSLGMESPYSRP
ncbi:MAG TPA: chemotaxis protein CheW [Stenomitos sp.]